MSQLVLLIQTEVGVTIGGYMEEVDDIWDCLRNAGLSIYAEGKARRHNLLNVTPKVIRDEIFCIGD